MMRRLPVPRPVRAPRRAAAAAACLVLALLGGCAQLQPPRPWEKEVLARPEMRMDASPLEARFGRQIYTSKEAASGGGGVGGGGCGCN